MAIEEGAIAKSTYHNVVGRVWGIEKPAEEAALAENDSKIFKSNKETKDAKPPAPQRASLTYLNERNEAITIQTSVSDLEEVGAGLKFGKFTGWEKEEAKASNLASKKDEDDDDDEKKTPARPTGPVNPPHRR